MEEDSLKHPMAYSRRKKPTKLRLKERSNKIQRHYEKRVQQFLSLDGFGRSASKMSYDLGSSSSSQGGGSVRHTVPLEDILQ